MDQTVLSVYRMLKHGLFISIGKEEIKELMPRCEQISKQQQSEVHTCKNLMCYVKYQI